jgi:hypothetical protein
VIGEYELPVLFAHGQHNRADSVVLASGDRDDADRHAAEAIAIAAPRGLVPAHCAGLAARAASAPARPLPRTRACCSRAGPTPRKVRTDGGIVWLSVATWKAAGEGQRRRTRSPEKSAMISRRPPRAST